MSLNNLKTINMKKYMIIAENKINKIAIQLTIANNTLPDAMEEAKQHINKTFAEDVSKNFELTPDPILSGVVMY